jgi:hypothetical protein
MYQEAHRLYPDALAYTYVNADILPDISFFQTVDRALQRFESFLLVGQRCNVNWNESTDIEEFDQHYKSGQLFVRDAQDYFVVSKSAIQWEAEGECILCRYRYSLMYCNIALPESEFRALSEIVTPSEEDFGSPGLDVMRDTYDISNLSFMPTVIL